MAPLCLVAVRLFIVHDFGLPLWRVYVLALRRRGVFAQSRMIESTTCGSIKTHFMRKLMTFTIWNVSNVDKDVIYQCSKSFKLFYGKLFFRAVFPYNLFGFRLCFDIFIRVQIIDIDKIRDLCSRCLLIFLLENSNSSACMFPIN